MSPRRTRSAGRAWLKIGPKTARRFTEGSEKVRRQFRMLYQKQTFTLPTTSRKMTQTDYEIRVGLRNPDGSLRRPKKK